MTTLFLKFIGGSLLVLCGGGIGWTSACHKKEAARRIEAFVRFLQYVQEAVRFRCLPGMIVLEMAAKHKDFTEFCPGGTMTFSQIVFPDCLEENVGNELREGLNTLETASRQSACDVLDHMCDLCRGAGKQAQEAAQQAQRLYPRMGACLGLLAAIVLV